MDVPFVKQPKNLHMAGGLFLPGRFGVGLHAEDQIADTHVIGTTVFRKGDLKQ